MLHQTLYRTPVFSPTYYHPILVVFADFFATFSKSVLQFSRQLGPFEFDQCQLYQSFHECILNLLDKLRLQSKSHSRFRKLIIYEINRKKKVLTSAKFNLFCCLRNSVTAYLSFIFRTFLPPLLLREGSTGLGRGLTNFTGGGSYNKIRLQKKFNLISQF